MKGSERAYGRAEDNDGDQGDQGTDDRGHDDVEIAVPVGRAADRQQGHDRAVVRQAVQGAGANDRDTVHQGRVEAGLVGDLHIGGGQRIEGGPLVSLALATNILAALTGSASGGLTIALDALAPTYMQIAHQTGLDPALMHRVAVIGAGTLDSLPHNGAVVTLLAVCGTTHKDGYFHIVMTAIVSALIALVAVIALGSTLGSF
jgi:hypothetical protein